MQKHYDVCQDICIFQQENVGIIRLTRQKALNALSHDMIKRINMALDNFALDNSIACVFIEGEGRAFCAGGDVVSAYYSGIKGVPLYDYFFDEYDLNAKINTYPKPYISLLDGICMGGGAGISIHGRYRVVTENTLFAMPETAIGFFTDVGSAKFLPNLSDNFGIYLALTGNSCKWGDCLQYGLATHAILQANLEHFKNYIIETGNYHEALEKFSVNIDYETSFETRSFIKHAFGKQSLEECLAYLVQYSEQGNAFAKTCLETLESRSPTSLKVIWRYVNECKNLPLVECLKIDKCIAYHMLENHDFYEGVRAALIDKDKKPSWKPKYISEISSKMIDTYFKRII